MKTLLSSATVAAALLAWNGRAAMEVRFTNQVVTFTNLQGQVYKDASLLRASEDQLVFKTNDIFGTVYLTNVSPATLEMLGVPASHIQAVQELQRQKEDLAVRRREAFADDQERLTDPKNLIPFRVQAVLNKSQDPVYGTLTRCQLRAADGSLHTAWVARLPDSVPAYFARVREMEGAIAQFDERLTQEAAQIDAAAADIRQQDRAVQYVAQNTPVVIGATDDMSYFNALANYHNYNAQAQTAVDNAKDALDARADALQKQQEQLDQMRADLDQLKRSGSQETAVQIIVSHYLHYNNPILVSAPKLTAPAMDAPK